MGREGGREGEGLGALEEEGVLKSLGRIDCQTKEGKKERKEGRREGGRAGGRKGGRAYQVGQIAGLDLPPRPPGLHLDPP